MRQSTIKSKLAAANVECDAAQRAVIAINNRMDIRMADTIAANPNHVSVIRYRQACNAVAMWRAELLK